MMTARAAACLLAVAAATTVATPGRSLSSSFVLPHAVKGSGWSAKQRRGGWGKMKVEVICVKTSPSCRRQGPAKLNCAAGASLSDIVAPPPPESMGVFAQCCRACSEWRALEQQLVTLERQLADGHAPSGAVAAALDAARLKVLRPALLAALELRDWQSGGAGRVRGDECLQVGYEAAVIMWSQEGWEHARDLMQKDAQPSPTADHVRHLRATMRTIVGNVEDSYVETFPPAKEALPQGEGERYRAQAVTVDLSSSPPPDLAASSLHRISRVAYDLLTGKLRKREWLRSALAGLLSRVLSRRTAAPQLAVGMRSPAAHAPAGEGGAGQAGVGEGTLPLRFSRPRSSHRPPRRRLRARGARRQRLSTMDSDGRYAHAQHYLSKDFSTHSFSASHAPAITIKPGELIQVQTWDCYKGAIDGMTAEQVALRRFKDEEVNPATGPIYVEGAEAGDTLSVTIHHIQPGLRGCARTYVGCGQLHEQCSKPHAQFFGIENGVVTMNSRISFPSKPMLGVIGVAPRGRDAILTMPAGAHGGNLDESANGIGATVHLQVHHPGALLSVGDMHASQGDGEICGTGVEVGGDVLLSVALRKGQATEYPVTELQDCFITHGVAEDLNAACKIACEEAAGLLVKQWSFTPEEAFIFLSVQGNVGICQNAHPWADSTVIAKCTVPKLSACPSPFACDSAASAAVSAGLSYSAIPAPASTGLVEDELPELLITPQRNRIMSFDTRDPEQAAAAMAAVRRCNQPVLLKHVGQAQGWHALESWTLERLASEFGAPAPPAPSATTSATTSSTTPGSSAVPVQNNDGGGAPLVNVRLAGCPNILQCNRQHPLIRNGYFVPPSQTRQIPVAEFLARIRNDRAERGWEPLVYGHEERLYLQSHATPGMLAECAVPHEWEELGVEVSGCTNLWVSTAGVLRCVYAVLPPSLSLPLPLPPSSLTLSLSLARSLVRSLALSVGGRVFAGRCLSVRLRVSVSLRERESERASERVSE